MLFSSTLKWGTYIVCTITDPGQLSLSFRSMVDMAPAAAGGGEEGERFSGT